MMARIAPPQPNETMARIAPPLFSAAAQRQTTKFCWSPASYELGWPSYYNIYYCRENVEVRVVQIFVRKLAANSSVFALFECAALPLKRVTRV